MNDNQTFHLFLSMTFYSCEQNELFQKLLFITNWVLTYNQIWFTITEAGFVFNTILKSILNAEIFVYTAVYFLNIFHSVLIHTPSQDNYKEG